MPQHRRALPLLVVAALAVPLAVASIAFACGRLATLKLDRASASAGSQVSAVGRNFSNNPQASTVTVRFNSRGGPVLWEGRPDRQGRFVARFTAPRVRTGHYVVLATQTIAQGRPVAGTPGRAPLRIRRSAARTSSGGAPPAGALPSAGGGSGGGLPAVPVSLAPLLLLLAGGATALVATGRRRSAATPTRR